MSTQKIISANAFKHNGATVLNAGTTDGSNVTNSVSLATNAANNLGYGNIPTAATSPTESGNLGRIKAISGDAFSANFSGNTYVGTNIDANLLGPGADRGRRKHPTQNQTNRINITAFDVFTGTETKGGNAGDAYNFGADHEHTTDGEFQLMETGKTPSSKDY